MYYQHQDLLEAKQQPAGNPCKMAVLRMEHIQHNLEPPQAHNGAVVDNQSMSML